MRGKSSEIISHDNTANTTNLQTAEPSDSNATQDVGTAAFQNHADLIPVIVVMPNPSQNTINQDDLQSIAPVSSSDNAALPDNYQQLLDVQLQNLLALVGLHNQIGAALNSQSHTDVSGNFDSFTSSTSGIFSSPTVGISSSDGSSGMMQTINFASATSHIVFESRFSNHVLRREYSPTVKYPAKSVVIFKSLAIRSVHRLNSELLTMWSGS